MKVLLASLLLLTLIFGFCIYSGIRVGSACDRLLDTAERADNAEGAKVLDGLWHKEKGILSFFVNRSLLAQAESALVKMQASLSDPLLFESAKAEFRCLLQTVRQSYGLFFSSIL